MKLPSSWPLFITFLSLLAADQSIGARSGASASLRLKSRSSPAVDDPAHAAHALFHPSFTEYADPPEMIEDGVCIPDWEASLNVVGLSAIICVILVIALLVPCFVIVRAPANDKEAVNGAPSYGSTASSSSTAAPREKRPLILPLDGMRTVLVTYVVLIHNPLSVSETVQPFIIEGWPMQFFFVLSGFVQRYVIEGKLLYFDRKSAVKAVIRRFARLAPLYWLAMAVTFCFILLTGIQCTTPQCRPLIAWPMNALFLQGLMPMRVCTMSDVWIGNGFMQFGANGSGWFTACLIWIAICYPGLHNLVSRCYKSQLLCIGALVAVLTLRMVPEILRPAWSEYGAPNGVLHLYSFAPVRLLEFLSGMLAAQAVTNLPDCLKKWQFWGWIFDAMMILSIAAVGISAKYFGNDQHYSGEYYLSSCWCILCALAALAAPHGGCGLLHRILGSWPLVTMAGFSYATYIMHGAIGSVLRWKDEHLVYFPMGLISVWLAGYFFAVTIERPVQRFVEVQLGFRAAATAESKAAES
mmetsp:Transcript_52151/g.113021  ORF Transcript_52151/g.113021 Transcript_52151/m.113021 type:complete len:525 (+) Transcript_52151:74-1648(+)